MSFSSNESPFTESMQDACGCERLNGIKISENVRSVEKNTSTFHISNALNELECTQIIEVLGMIRHIFAFNDNELGRAFRRYRGQQSLTGSLSQRKSLGNHADRIYVCEWDHTTIQEPIFRSDSPCAQERRQGTDVHRFSQNKRDDEKGRIPFPEDRRHVTCRCTQ